MQVISCEIYEIYMNAFFEEHLPTATSLSNLESRYVFVNK